MKWKNMDKRAGRRDQTRNREDRDKPSQKAGEVSVGEDRVLEGGIPGDLQVGLTRITCAF